MLQTCNINFQYYLEFRLYVLYNRGQRTLEKDREKRTENKGRRTEDKGQIERENFSF